MFKIAICDDVISTTTEIETLLSLIANVKNYELDIDIFFDGSALVKQIAAGSIYDIIYLDIEMNELDGIKAAQYIRSLRLPSLLIYISAYDSYCKQLFEVEPFRFLSKPIDTALFNKYFLAACNRLETKILFFPFSFKQRIYKVCIADIIYFESKGRYIIIHTSKQDYRYIDKIRNVEDFCLKHDLNFLRIQQSYLVNPYYISNLCLSEVTLCDDVTLPISTKYQKTVLQHYLTLAEDL